MSLYVDNSVLTAFYAPERLSDEINELLSSATSAAISNLTEVEFFAAVAKKARRAEFDSNEADRIRNAFLSHLERFFYKRLPLDTAHIGLARSWLHNDQVPLATLDALHVAVACLNECTLVTADRQQARAAEALGVEVKLLGA